MTDSGRRILSQGDCDSACFLYALANASIALTEQPKLGDEKWDGLWNEATDSLPASRPFLRSCTGTAPWDDQTQHLEAIASKFLTAICKGRLEVKLEELTGFKKDAARERISSLVSETSVVVAANKYHWFVVVEAEGPKWYVACSAHLNEVGSAYKEDNSPKFNRPYNSFPYPQVESLYPKSKVWETAFIVSRRQRSK